MKYLIVSGSARPNGQSMRIATWLSRRFDAADEVTVLDLHEAYVPWDASALWDEGSEESKAFAPVRYHLEWCDALVMVSPEWHGMPPAKIIGLLQAACTGATIAHKPGLIVGESDSRGGAFPAALLRGFTSKNTRVNWIPEHLIIRFNHEMFHSEPTNDDAYIQKRARYCIDLLRRYTDALAPARHNLMIGSKDFPNGM